MKMLSHTPDQERRYLESGMWGNSTLVERFRQRAAEAPGKMAITDAKKQYTYGELARLVDNLATNFLALDIGPGQVVAVQVPNWAELPLIHFALNRIGALCLPVHEHWRDMEVGHLLKQSGAVDIVVPKSYRGFDYPAMIAGMRSTLPRLRKIYSIGGATPHSEAFEPLLDATSVDVKALDARRPHPNEPAAIMLSSGTTALPKISLYSSNNFHALANQTLDALRCQRDDIAAGLASCGTGAVGYIFPVMSPLLHGASSVLLEHWDPAAGVDMLLKHRCTYAVAVPAQMTQMLPLLKTHSPLDFANFRAFFNGGAPLPHEVARQVEELMDCRVLCNYGSTDGGVCVTITWDDSREKRLSTVGRPGVEREVKLVDSNGNTVASGEQGEIYWRSPEKSYGYMNDEAATQVAFTEDRFYRSGDLGRLDEDGYLMVVGRVKDMILRGGRNMSPRIIEDTMIKHPAVLEVAVAAMPDPILGERACAFAVLKNGSKLEFDELIAFLKREKLSVWMLPERLEIMEDLPRSAGGKIAKNKLTAFISARLQEEAGQRGS